MGRDELAAYLDDLREDLTGHYQGMQPRADGAERRQRPDGDVEVLEQNETDDGERTWRVTLNWTAGEDAGDE